MNENRKKTRKPVDAKVDLFLSRAQTAEEPRDQAAFESSPLQKKGAFPLRSSPAWQPLRKTQLQLFKFMLVHSLLLGLLSLSAVQATCSTFSVTVSRPPTPHNSLKKEEDGEFFHHLHLHLHLFFFFRNFLTFVPSHLNASTMSRV
jgi:hypothetical protein